MLRFTLSVILGLALSSPTWALDINPIFNDNGAATWTATQKSVVYQAIADWEAIIGNDESFDVTFDFTTDGTYLGQWAGSVTYFNGDDILPWYTGVTHTVHFNADKALWWDTTPTTDDDIDGSQWDALSVARHELGHAMGYTSLYTSSAGDDSKRYYDAHVDSDAVVFDAGGLDIDLAASDNIYHVAQSYDNLMSPALTNGVRRDIDAMNLDMLSLAYGYDIIPEPATFGLLCGGGLVLLFRRTVRGRSA